MFRKGPPRARGFRRPLRAGAVLGARPRQLARQANLLEASGQFGEAAQQFARLADAAAVQGTPDRAGSLSLQAARSFLNAGDTANAVSRLRQGLTGLLASGRERRARKALEQALAALRARKLNAEADLLQKDFSGLAGPAGPDEVEPTPRGHLPPKCPHCGGPMRVDEADWIDEASAECPYCGTPVQTVGG